MQLSLILFLRGRMEGHWTVLYTNAIRYKMLNDISSRVNWLDYHLNKRLSTASLSSSCRVFFHSTESEWLSSVRLDLCGLRMWAKDVTFIPQAPTERQQSQRLVKLVRPPVRFQPRLELCQVFTSPTGELLETLDHTGSLCAGGSTHLC